MRQRSAILFTVLAIAIALLLAIDIFIGIQTCFQMYITTLKYIEILEGDNIHHPSFCSIFCSV